MNEPAPAAPQAIAAKQPISWLRFVGQLVAVVAVYLVGSTLPVLPETVEAVRTGTAPDISSAKYALTTVVSMALALALAWLFVRREARKDPGRLREAFGIDMPARWLDVLPWVAIGVGGTLALFAGMGWLVQQLGLPEPDPTFILALVTESPATLAIWIVGVAWFAAGFGEEMLYRGFLMDRLERLGGLRGRMWLVIVIQALLFGLPHAYQGSGGMVVTASVGLLLGWIRVVQRGNLWAVILAHAAVDTIMMGLAYADKLGWYAG